MSYFTWKETGLTKDCESLEAMASRFEESAKLMRKMAREGFILKIEKKKQLILTKIQIFLMNGALLVRRHHSVN